MCIKVITCNTDMALDSLPTAVLLGVLMVATAIDGRQHRVPNMLTANAAMLGLILQHWLHGWAGVFNGLTGLSASLLLLLPFYTMRWMGAGDVKLQAAVGSFVGWPSSLLAVGLSLGLGSLLAFFLLAVKGGLADYLRRYGFMVKCLLLTGRFAYIPPQAGAPPSQVFPYAIAIALGTLATLAWGGRLVPFVEMLGSLYHG